jgi:hypothetical protein
VPSTALNMAMNTDLSRQPSSGTLLVMLSP